MSEKLNDNAKLWRDYCISHGSAHRYKKGEEIGHSPAKAPYLGNIVTGAFKLVVSGDDGTEHVLRFLTEGDFVSDYPFDILAEKQKFKIVSVAESSVFCVPISSAVLAAKEDREWLFSLSRLIFQKIVGSYINLYTKSPERRYLDLVDSEPYILEQFTLGDIASYLNVTRTHLSRIRNNLFKP